MNTKDILSEKEKERPSLERWLEKHKYQVGLILILILLAGVIVYGAGSYDRSPSPDSDQATTVIASVKKEMDDIRQENETLKSELSGLNTKLNEIKNALASSQINDGQANNEAGGKVAGVSASRPTENQAQIPASPQPSGIININTASAGELEKLPGVGPARAADIIQYRQANGGFKTPEEIMNIRGIGEKTFEKMKGMITVK